MGFSIQIFIGTWYKSKVYIDKTYFSECKIDIIKILDHDTVQCFCNYCIKYQIVTKNHHMMTNTEIKLWERKVIQTIKIKKEKISILLIPQKLYYFNNQMVTLTFRISCFSVENIMCEIYSYENKLLFMIWPANLCLWWCVGYLC